jgi:3',5'-cyclic AMP phosphodiesterase CpdA
MSTRFVVISDTHFYAPRTIAEDDVYWNGVLQTRSPEIGACLVETIDELNPDFVIHCGDITGLCELENWAFACRLLDGLRCPWYAALGNHDTWYPGVREAFAERFGACYYRRDLAGIRFLFLDLVHWYDSQGHRSPYRDLIETSQIGGMGADDEQLRWLEAELAADTDRPIALVSHPPLGFKPAYPIASWPRGEPVIERPTPLDPLFGEVVYRSTIQAALRSAPHVKVAFAGHWHIMDATHQDGVVHCQTASLREFPFEIRTVEIDSATMKIRTVPLKDPAFRQASFLPAWNNAWVSGSPADRAFGVELE